MKRKINSKQKGSRAELELVKILTKRFRLPFARVGVSSGARVKNTKLPENAIGMMTSDIIVPSGFKFSVECKAVNKDIDLLAPSALLDTFLKQTVTDAKSVEKTPMLCWKRNRRGWIAVVPSWAFLLTGTRLPAYHSQYQGWLIFKLETLLEIQHTDFWFMVKEGGSPPSA